MAIGNLASVVLDCDEISMKHTAAPSPSAHACRPISLGWIAGASSSTRPATRSASQSRSRRSEMAYSGTVLHASDGGLRSTRAVYPGTFDPFTPGHLDLVDRSRHMFDQVTVLVAVNDSKQPTRTTAARAGQISDLLPVDWDNVAVAVWHGLTVDYCRRNGCAVIIRGLRNTADCLREYELAAANEALGVTTLFIPARPDLAAMSSTAVRALRS
jgi:pantetheine-phosphate adenylyltransferase